MDLEVTPAFPTLIGRLRVPDAEAMNRLARAHPCGGGGVLESRS
jgi:hypothetical protein